MSNIFFQGAKVMTARPPTRLAQAWALEGGKGGP